MRTPPPTRTWGQPPAQIVIRQSAPIWADKFFENVWWAGMELIEGWLMPKGAGLSNEEKELDADLCSYANQELEGYLAGYVDWLPIIKSTEKRQLEVGYIVTPASHSNEALEEELERWFSFGYREVWVFRPWCRTVDVYTSPSHKQQVRGEVFESPFFKAGRSQWQLPLSDIWKLE